MDKVLLFWRHIFREEPHLSSNSVEDILAGGEEEKEEISNETTNVEEISQSAYYIKFKGNIYR